MDELTELALAAGAGDRSSLERFVERTQAEVYRFCIHLSGPGRAEELTQETYLRAIPSLARFRGDSSALTWLLSITRRVVVDDVRRDVRQRRLQERIVATTDPVGAVESVGSAEVDDLLGRLDHDRREAFVLTQLLGFRYHEAAEVLDCPIGTVRSRVARARADLVALIGVEAGDDDGSAPGNRRTGSDDY